jgi:hypothetical protein
MSTRCTVTVHENPGDATLPPDRVGNGEQCSIYRHSDGYPDGEHGVPATMRAALAYAWPLPRFEADDFAAAMVAAWKAPGVPGDRYRTGGGNIRLLPHGVTPDAFAGDSEWHYSVWCDKGRIMCRVWEATFPEGYDGSRVWQAQKRVRVIATPKTARFPAAEPAQAAA